MEHILDQEQDQDQDQDQDEDEEMFSTTTSAIKYLKYSENVTRLMDIVESDTQKQAYQSFIEIIKSAYNPKDINQWKQGGEMRQHYINFTNAIGKGRMSLSNTSNISDRYPWLQRRSLFTLVISWTAIDIDTIEQISNVLIENDVTTILDPLAGHGFIDILFQSCGMNTISFDIKLQDEQRRWTNITQADALTLNMEEFKDTCLLLSWVDYGSDLGEQLIKKFMGKYVIYIGEIGGCTGNGDDFAELDSNWTEIQYFKISTFYGINDQCYLFKRKVDNI